MPKVTMRYNFSTHQLKNFQNIRTCQGYYDSVPRVPGGSVKLKQLSGEQMGFASQEPSARSYLLTQQLSILELSLMKQPHDCTQIGHKFMCTNFHLIFTPWEKI